MTKRLKVWRLLATLLALTLIAAACSPSDGDSTTTTAEAAEATTPDATTTTEEAMAATTTTEAPMLVCDGAIGSMFPITGPVAFIGEVQNNWAKYALDVYNVEHGTAYEYVEGDTMFDVAQASVLAAQIIDDGSVMAVVGPAGSDQTDAAGAAFEAGDANLVFISPSSTREGITAQYTAMFRTVPTDNAQALTTAEFMVDGGATKVFMIDDQSSYSTGLADAVVVLLEAGGVEVIRESVAQDVIDFSALVGTIPDDTDWVYLPWQLAANGQILGNQLAEQGKAILIFGSDGMDSGDFTIAGSVIANFAPDISILPDKADVLEGYLALNADTNTFGPPTFAAVHVIAEAFSRVCNADGEISRAAVLAEVQATDQADSIVGSPINFDEKSDLVGGKFFLAEIQDDGSKTPVG